MAEPIATPGTIDGERNDTSSILPLQVSNNLPIHFSLPLSEFAQLYLNRNKDLIVGAAIRHTRPHGTSPCILLIQRASHEDYYPNQWELPGGHAEIETDPTVLDAVVREVREETGLKVTGIQKEFEGFEYRTGAGEGAKWRRQWNFVVEVKEGEVRLDEREHQAWRWVEMEEVHDGDMGMTEQMRECVQAAIKAVAEDDIVSKGEQR